MLTRLLLVSLFALIVSCEDQKKKIEIPNLEICSVAGSMLMGANCAETLTDKTKEIDFDSLIEILEPNQKRGGAMIISAHDFMLLKTALDSACVALKDRCADEVKHALKKTDEAIKTLEIMRQ